MVDEGHFLLKQCLTPIFCYEVEVGRDMGFFLSTKGPLWSSSRTDYKSLNVAGINETQNSHRYLKN